VAYIGQKRRLHTCGVLVGEPEGNRSLGGTRIRCKTFKWILKKQGWTAWNGFMWLRIGDIVNQVLDLLTANTLIG
jgi:hypothetical protein